MAGSKTDFLESLSLDLILGAVPAGWTRPASLAQVHLALFTTVPTDSAAGTEATGGGYVRKAITNDAVNFPPAEDGVKRNGTEITFAMFTGPIGTVVGWALFDDAGNRLFWGDFAAPDQKEFGANDQFIVPVEGLTITED